MQAWEKEKCVENLQRVSSTLSIMSSSLELPDDVQVVSGMLKDATDKVLVALLDEDPEEEIKIKKE